MTTRSHRSCQVPDLDLPPRHLQVLERKLAFGDLAVLGCEGLPNRVNPKPREIGGGCSPGTFLGHGVIPAMVTGSGLAQRSGSRQ